MLRKNYKFQSILNFLLLYRVGWNLNVSENLDLNFTPFCDVESLAWYVVLMRGASCCAFGDHSSYNFFFEGRTKWLHQSYVVFYPSWLSFVADSLASPHYGERGRGVDLYFSFFGTFGWISNISRGCSAPSPPWLRASSVDSALKVSRVY